VNQQLSFDAPQDDATERVDEVYVYCDGGARGNPGPAAIGAVVLDKRTTPPRRLAEVSEAIGSTTNNVAEYRALIAGVEAARTFRPRQLRVRADSLLVVNQLRGQWKVKHEGLRPLYQQARALLREFERVDLAHVPRAENAEADALVNRALDAQVRPGSR
jgi:ribonuclease HI